MSFSPWGRVKILTHLDRLAEPARKHGSSPIS